MVMQDAAHAGNQVRNIADDGSPQPRMGLDQLPVFGIELPFLVEYSVGNADLPYIVEQRSGAHPRHLFRRQSDGLRQQDRISVNPSRVSIGTGVLRLNG